MQMEPNTIIMFLFYLCFANVVHVKYLVLYIVYLIETKIMVYLIENKVNVNLHILEKEGAFYSI